jgi:hypothetical protein
MQPDRHHPRGDIRIDGVAGGVYVVFDGDLHVSLQRLGDV